MLGQERYFAFANMTPNTLLIIPRSFINTFLNPMFTFDGLRQESYENPMNAQYYFDQGTMESPFEMTQTG